MIETERTQIRPIAPKDSEAIFSYRSDAETNEYQGWVPKTLKEVDQFIAKNQHSFNTPQTWFQLVIVEKETDKVIGDIGVHFIDSDNFQSEIGCTLRKGHHGKGFASEALKAVVDYLFVQLNKHRITASIDPLNTASIKLIEGLGFRKEAHFKESLWIDGKWVDDIVYGMLKKEWRS